MKGLIPRGKQLVSLGGTFFLAFWPFLLVISALFSGIFWVSFRVPKSEDCELYHIETDSTMSPPN